MAELGVGHISIVASTGGMQRDIQKAFSGLDSSASKAGESLGSRLSSGISKTLKVGAAATGAAVAGTLGASIAKGFGRLQAFDQAEAKFRGLGKSAEEITTIMDGVNDAVTGTVFGLDEAAGSAAKLSGVGVEAGEEMNRMMTLTADIAAQAGRGMGEMDSVMAKILGSGKLTGETLAQLDDAATGASGAIADHLNVSIEEMRDMVSKGEVDVETFATAMEGHLGGAAQAGGETFSGAMSMVGSALGRLGATLIGPLFEAAPKIFGALTDAVNNLHERVTPLAEAFGEWLAPRVADFAENLGPRLESAIEGIATVIGNVVGFVRDNSDWLGPLVAAVAGAVGAWAAWTGAIKLWQKVTKIATGVQMAFNAVMSANPIMLIVMAIAALVAGLAYFFTQTEMGKELWASFTEFLGNAWDWVVEKFTAGWTWISENVVTPFKEGWADLGARFGEIGEGLKAAWQGVSDFFTGVWEWIKSTVFDAWNWYVDSVRRNFEIATGAISAGWQWLSDSLGAVWGWIRANVFDAFRAGIAAVAGWFGEKISQIQAVWHIFQGYLHAGWVWIDQNVFAPIRAGVQWVADWFSRKVEDIRGIWQRLQDLLWAGWHWIDQNVFEGIRGGLDRVQGWFQVAVDAITRIWDGIKAAAARPVRFVVDTVFNNGIRPAWNAVAKFTGLDKLQPVALGDLGAYAHGGVLPGYTPGRDPYMFVEPRTGMKIGLSGGEAIMRPEVTRALGVDNVDGLNAAARMGGVSAVQRYLGGFASGGVIGSISDAVRKFFPMMTITSTLRPGDPGWHGQGKAVDFSNGTDSTPQMRSAAQWFYANYGPGLLELIHSPFNNNVKNGRNVGDGFGFYGAGTMNGHRNHVHVAAPAPLGDPSVMVEMLEDAGSGSGFSLFSMVKSLWDKGIEKIGSWSGPGLIGQLPGAMLSKLAEAAWNTIKSAAEKVAAVFGGAGGSAGNAESWREMAMWAMRREGFNADDPAQVNAMLAQIMSESGGNPGIAQQIVDVNGTGESAGVGLLQIIPGTFAAYRDPELPDDRRDPEANMVAALRYYRARYGTDLTTMWGHGHGYARGGVLPGYTPGRDVHQFFSPTGGALALSGGEAIMVPEWTRAVGGPAAVARMNAAASGGRTGSVSGAFAAGGVWQARGEDMARVIADELARIEAHLAKVADPSTYEGVLARSLAGKAGEIAGALGFNGVSTIIGGLIGAENELLDARDGHAERLAKITESESALESARKALSEAESAEYEDDAARADALAKATDEVAKAENDLMSARQESVRALDMPVYDLLPQLHDGLLGASRAAAGFHPALGGVAAGLAQAASLAGPAGVSVGVAVAGVQAAISVAKVLAEFITGIVDNFTRARLEVARAVGSMASAIRDVSAAVDDVREKIAGLTHDQAIAAIEVAAAERELRIARWDGIISVLDGERSVAEAQAAFDAQRRKDMALAVSDYEDLSLAHDRFRWGLLSGLDSSMDELAAWSDESHALYAELLAAQTGVQILELQAQRAVLEATYKSTLAALDLADVTASLGVAAQHLAIMTGQSFGMSTEEAMFAQREAELLARQAEIEGQKGQDWWRLFSWHASGANYSADRELEKINQELAALRSMEGYAPMGDAAQREINDALSRARWMGFMGGGDHVADMIRSTALGDPARALDQMEFEQSIVDLRASQDALRRSIERNAAELENRSQVDPLDTQIGALEYELASHETWAEYWRADSDGLRSSLAKLAGYQADAAEAAQTPAQVNLYGSTANMDDVQAMLEELGYRVNRLEAPPASGRDVVNSRR